MLRPYGRRDYPTRRVRSYNDALVSPASVSRTNIGCHLSALSFRSSPQRSQWARTPILSSSVLESGR